MFKNIIIVNNYHLSGPPSRQSHLTSACWWDFSKYVQVNEDWRAVRKEASEQEKMTFRIKKKNPSYFTFVRYGKARPRGSKVTPVKSTAVKPKTPTKPAPAVKSNTPTKLATAVKPKTPTKPLQPLLKVSLSRSEQRPLHHQGVGPL